MPSELEFYEACSLKIEKNAAPYSVQFCFVLCELSSFFSTKVLGKMSK